MAGPTGATGATGPAEIGGYPNIRSTPIYLVASRSDGVRTIISASTPGIQHVYVDADSVAFVFPYGTFGAPGADFVNLMLQGYVYEAGQGYRLLEKTANYVPVDVLGGGSFVGIYPGNFTNVPFMFVIQHAY